MSNHTYRVLNIVGSSPHGVTQAIESGIAQIRETVRHLDWFEVSGIRGQLTEDGVQHYPVEMKVGFRVVEAKDLLHG